MSENSVLVVGSGGAGLSAAIEAHDAGASVTVVECDSRPGGSTAMSAGVVLAADTDVQRAAGIEDRVDAMYQDYMAATHWLLEPRLVRALCEGAHDAVPWLESLGVTFPPEGLHAGGMDGVLRSHLPAPTDTDLGPSGGAAIVAALVRAVEERSIELLTDTKVAELTEEGGAVTGLVTADGERLRARAVVLATGGFGANPEMLAERFPRAVANADHVWYLGTPNARGEGIGMGERVGAAIEGDDVGVVFVTPGFQEAPDAFFPPWLVFVNSAGRRFIDEMAPYAAFHDAVLEQPGGRCWAIMDHAGFSGAGDDPKLSDPYGYGVEMASNWRSATLAEQLESGRVRRGETIEDLATGAGIDAAALRATLDIYNADAREGADRVFAKAPPHVPLETPPFYAVEMKPSMIAITFSGLRIDADGRVLDRAGSAIPGLFAAGETTGGVQGVRYGGSGASIANALVFGRRAGVAAARTNQPAISS